MEADLKKWKANRVDAFLNNIVDEHLMIWREFSHSQESYLSNFTSLGNHVMAIVAFVTSIVLALRSVGFLETSFLTVIIIAVAIGTGIYLFLSFARRQAESTLARVESAQIQHSRELYYMKTLVEGLTVNLDSLTIRQISSLFWYAPFYAAASRVKVIEAAGSLAHLFPIFSSARQGLLDQIDQYDDEIKGVYSGYERTKEMHAEEKNFLSGIGLLTPLLQRAAKENWEAINLENYVFTLATATVRLTISIRNPGTIPVTLQGYSVTDSSGATYTRLPWKGPSITPDTTQTATISINTGCNDCSLVGSPFQFAPGNQYTVILATIRKSQFRFPLRMLAHVSQGPNSV